MAKVLVVDDETEIIQMITTILETKGHTVCLARDGIDALAKVASERPDVIILDLNLPRLDGFEVCKRLKADQATRSIPVVMLTADYTSMNDASRGVDAGADEYVVKPFLPPVLLHNIERLLAGTAK
jgi:DNA-binding response OmpR family regulator